MYPRYSTARTFTPDFTACSAGLLVPRRLQMVTLHLSGRSRRIRLPLDIPRSKGRAALLGRSRSTRFNAHGESTAPHAGGEAPPMARSACCTGRSSACSESWPWSKSPLTDPPTTWSVTSPAPTAGRSGCRSPRRPPPSTGPPAGSGARPNHRLSALISPYKQIC